MVPHRAYEYDAFVSHNAVAGLADDASLAGRVLLWWSDDEPKLIQWGDRGYRDWVTADGDALTL